MAARSYLAVTHSQCPSLLRSRLLEPRSLPIVPRALFTVQEASLRRRDEKDKLKNCPDLCFNTGSTHLQ